MRNDGPDEHKKNAMINIPSAPWGTLRYDLCKCPCGVDTRFPGLAPYVLNSKAVRSKEDVEAGEVGHGILGHVLITNMGEEKRMGDQRVREGERE